MTRVLVFALDGCTYQIVKNLNISFFNRLMNGGRYGEMETVPPANTTIGWSSFYTGKNPGKTGIFNKTEGDVNLKSFHESRLGVKSPALWDIVGEEGLKSVVFNIPVTYPALPMNGCLISSFDAKGDAWAYPFELKEKIEQHWTPKETPLSEYNNPQILFDDLWVRVSQEAKVAATLLIKNDWNLAIIGFLELDRISHALLNNISPTFQQCVKGMYERIGQACLELWSLFKEDTVCVVVCDHGMRSTDAGFFINSFLYKTDHISLKEQARELEAYGTDKTLNDINFESSEAWSSGLGGISVKDIDLIEDIITYLEEYIDPKTNKKVFNRVLPREKVWEGKFLNDMPELLAFPGNGFETHWTNITPTLMRINKGFCDHDINNGFYAVTGMTPEEKPGHILEIAPTILKILDVKIPDDFDRKPLF